MPDKPRKKYDIKNFSNFGKFDQKRGDRRPRREQDPPGLAVVVHGDDVMKAYRRLKKKIMKVKDNIETVKKVSNRLTTNCLLLERKLFEASGNINTRQEKRIANPELIKKTGKLTSKPKNFAFLGPINEVEALFKFLFI